MAKPFQGAQEMRAGDELSAEFMDLRVVSGDHGCVEGLQHLARMVSSEEH